MLKARYNIGFPQYNAFINDEKTMKNFTEDEANDLMEELEGRGDSSTLKVSEEQFFAWCGLLIDTQTLEVRIDYSKSLQGGIFFSPIHIFIRYINSH